MSTPLAIGLSAAPAQAAPVDISIIGTNDFHGRLLPGFNIPGAAKYAGALNELRAANPNTVFTAAGDLIGATTFESFIQQDKPTIDVLNEMGLDVSAVGNHELDKGWDDLTDRVMQPESPTNEFGGAAWEYIAANLIGPPGEEELIEDSWTTDVSGVTVGFVGAVTEDLPTLVSPSGIEGVQVTDIVDAVNTEADRLVAEESADLVVMLVHEGAPSTNCDTMTDPSTTWGNIVTGVNSNVSAIISGHTHLAYNCTIGGRPVVSAGQYGSHLNKLDFTVESTTGEVVTSSQSLIDVNAGNFAPDPEVEAIVAAAAEEADELGAAPLGDIAAPFNRARRGNGSENRGGESTLGNLVAEVQRWATSSEEAGAAEIAFMNPGGLREDMIGTQDDGYPETVTYKQAAVVQPFANTLVNMTMTGEQIRRLLEQQWQPGASRPFLKLGVSEGFEYTYRSYDADPAEDVTAIRGEIHEMWLHGTKIEDSDTFSVTANSFLASGGDSFAAFTESTDQRDTGKIDLEAMVDYLDEFASEDPLEPDYAQSAVGVEYPDGQVVNPRQTITLELSSLAMTGPGDVQDEKVIVMMGDREVGRATVDNSVAATEAFDESGRATVDVTIPVPVKPGPQTLEVIGEETGTSVSVPVRITKRPPKKDKPRR